MTQPFIYIGSPDGTLRRQPQVDAPANFTEDPGARLAAARARLRPGHIAPDAAIGRRARAWLDHIDAECPDRSLAVLAIAAKTRAALGLRPHSAPRPRPH